MDFARVVKQLIRMEPDIRKKTFNPDDWHPARVKERLLENKAHDWLDSKQAEAEAGKLSYETLKDYRGYVTNYFMKLPSAAPLGRQDVREVRFEDLKTFKDNLHKNLKIKTRRNIMNALHAFFNWTRLMGSVRDMPAFPAVEGNDSDIRIALEYQDQLEALSRIPEKHRDVIEFGFETGLRPGETCALKIGDIDLKRREAVIQRTWSGSRLRETTKGKKSLRSHYPTGPMRSP